MIQPDEPSQAATGADGVRVTPILRVVTAAENSAVAGSPSPRAAWGEHATLLWPAWKGALEWEMESEAQFGDWLADELLVLWAISRFGDEFSEPALNELVREDLRPRFGNELLEDVARFGFALGASWAASRLPNAAPR